MACMDATQQIEDSFFGEEDDSDDEQEVGEGKRQREPLAVLKVFKNNHVPETEVPLYLGENVLGRDPASCSVPLQARSVSSRHAIISISVFSPNDRRGHSEATEALLWDLGSLNGTRKGRLKLTPQVRYALTEGDSVVLADLPCQYISLKNTHTSTADGGTEKVRDPTICNSVGRTVKGVENGRKKSTLPPVPVWADGAKSLQSLPRTPTKQERTLVPESDSDSDGEKHGRREKRKIMASDSASSELSSPTCSTFLTPASKVIPESEDESSITPSPALKGRFAKTGNDTEVSSDSSKPDPLHFDIDSDTDAEDEEVEMRKTAAGIEAAVTAVNPADLHMDSDTDVEEEEMEKTKSDPEAADAPVKQDSVNPAAPTTDSDTDVEENEPVKTDTTTLSPGPEAAQDEKKEPVQCHMESDTDVEDEDVSHVRDSRPPTSRVAEFNMNSDTDVDEDEETANATEPPCEVDSKDLEKKQAKSVDSVKDPDDEMLRRQSDSDTDVEDDVAEVRIPGVAERTGSSQTRSEIRTADDGSTDARHDSPVDVQPPAAAVRDEFRLDSDIDVEEEEDKVEEKEQKCEEAAIKIVHSSTPRGAGLSEEELETQAFLSPSQMFKRPGLPSLLLPSVSPGGISNPDDDFAVAETQSFVCDAAQADATLDETPQSLHGPESRRSDGASSFQLGLSDSSHRVPEAEVHDGEPAEEDWQLQATQLYAMKNSEGTAKAGQTQLDLDATQAYTDLIGQEEEGGGGKEEKEEATQPLDALGHSSTHTAETQLIKHRGQDEDQSDHDTNEVVVASEPERKAEEEDDEMQVDSHLSTADTLLIFRSPRQEEPSQPYAFLAAQIPKQQEEKEKAEQEKSDQEVQETDEGERAQNEVNENVGQENDDEEEEEGRERKENEGVVMETKNDMRDGSEEEKKERGEDKRVENDNEVDEVRKQPAEAKTIVETLPIYEEEEGQEEEENKPRMNRRPGRRRQTAKVEPKQPVESDKVTHVAIPETQPMCEEEERLEEEQLSAPSSSRRTQPAKVESTQPFESDNHIHVAIAETLPMGEEEEGQEEEENKSRKSRRPGRRRQTAKVELKQPVKSDKVNCVIISETQPMCEEDVEGHDEEQLSEATSTKRSIMRRHSAKGKPVKPVESHVAIPETLPMCEDEEEQQVKPQSGAKTGRKSRRGRQTAKTESTQPLEPDSTAEPVKTDEEEEEQDRRRSLRGKERGKAASGRGKGRGRAAAEKEKRGKRGKVEQEEDSEEELDQGNEGRVRKNLRQKSKDDDKARPEQVEAENEETQGLNKQEDEEESKRLQREKKEEAARLERERKDRVEREEREKREKEEKDRLESERIEREKKEREEREMKEREEKRLEKERREQEERRRLEQERIEKEKKEKEEKEKLEKEMRERQELEEKLEKERKEQERIEKEKKEKEEKEKLEKEMRERQEREEKLEEERKEQEERQRLEQERIEKEKKEKEEKEKLEKEMRDRQEREEKLEEERKEQEEKHRLAREKRDREERECLEKEMRVEKEKQEKQIEQKEKEKESEMGLEKEKRQAPGKRKTGLGRKAGKRKKGEEQELEKETTERLETEQELTGIQKPEREEGRSKKQEDERAEGAEEPKRGRRSTRKSVAPPADVEDEGGPAKRTRSRSNSSNSVCSEQSTQDSLNDGRRSGGRRKTAEEVNERGRRRTTAVPSSEKEDIKRAAYSRSNSRSSETSSSVATQSRGRGGRGRKSVKTEEPEAKEKGERLAAVGRGRGRGGKRPGANDIKAEATGEAKKEEAEVMAVAEDGVMNQSSSRGRKRGACVSMLVAETPQPTPKTPRRSLPGQTHKVLFTGVVDEDGEKVLVRLGGGMAKGVGDMTHLVTDKVRRTVKFLCAVARGVPIVTPAWLSKCGKAGSFLSPNGFLVKDAEQEKRFNFSLQDALTLASSQPLLQGYEIHVTPSVKPEPAQMKEIITCCGARFLPKMPSAHKAQTVVVSCEEDRAVCERARSLSLPVVSAEFLLTGILQQKVDLQTHALALSPAAAVPKPAARSRGK